MALTFRNYIHATMTLVIVCESKTEIKNTVITMNKNGYVLIDSTWKR